jgi:hypothetical protein
MVGNKLLSPAIFSEERAQVACRQEVLADSRPNSPCFLRVWLGSELRNFGGTSCVPMVERL